ncbi:MAG: DEAD/DEAH box helicase [Deltaproteobacteria bacterium]|nr:DEAD/DEAH box helicase [Deltaproteobacteria bacterium]
MLMTKRLEPGVPNRIRQRGIRYWKAGWVKIVGSEPGMVESSVSGTQDYDVSVFWSFQEALVEGSCTCPYFGDRLEMCKHIWATLLAAEQAGLLPSTRGVPVLDFEPVDGVEDSLLSEKSTAEGSSFGRLQPAVPAWQSCLEEVQQPGVRVDPGQRPWLEGRQLFYVLNVDSSESKDAVVIDLRCRDRKKDGDWGKLKSSALDRDVIPLLPDPVDRQLLALLLGAEESAGRGWYGYGRDLELPKRLTVPGEIVASWVRLAAETGRLMMPGAASKEVHPVTWDGGEPWTLTLEVSSAVEGFLLRGFLDRGEARLPLSEPALVASSGLIFHRHQVARLAVGGAFGFVPLLRREGEIAIPADHRDRFLGTLLALPRPPELRLPEALHYEELAGHPSPQLRIQRREGWSLTRKQDLEAFLLFDYQGESVSWLDGRQGVYRPEPPRFLRRDFEAEGAALARLRQLGVREVPHEYAEHWVNLKLLDRQLAGLVQTLTSEGWRVEAEGQLYREAGELDLEVSTSIDWFDLRGAADFGEQRVELPRLLQALKRGEKTVLLDDGSMGLLPESWLDKLEPLAQLGELGEQGLRFRSSQVGLMDALLVAQPEIKFDQAVARARRQLAKFSGVKPREAPRTFKAVLRDYQKSGLGWLHFLRTFGFGGCLADDMGLGKTVQVLALLESRRQGRHSKATPEKERPAVSLVVVPKSLVFNWINEAQRFTPLVRVLDYTGPKRRHLRDAFDDFDVVITTYGTLRRDVAFLKEQNFDYAILDEAQAMKNAKSATAKACRLLQAQHRLALTGTPIENHLGELRSILDFLNPGLFGPGGGSEQLRGVGKDALNEDGSPHPRLALIAGAIKPFILRRTKAQVATDLPDKVQQPIYCDLLPQQRKDYDQLRRHYQQLLLDKVAKQGLGRSKIQVLEALLRLRQAACHPGLMDPTRREEDSAKLAVLLSQLEEVIGAGHKSLVFSQFTSMLSIVRSRLDARGIAYEYLDGRTRKREMRIQRFQEDPECKVFLISLKAGGVGLNLTAAEYVFLLDPWWNPAVEAQAIDRTHRIGQTQTVFAYSLISRDTVEEKVLQLQQSKRELADAILRADNSLLRSLTQEDLAKLLS